MMFQKELKVGLVQQLNIFLKTPLSCAHTAIVVHEQSSSKLPAPGICCYHQQSGFFFSPHHNINNCKLEKLHHRKNDPGIKKKPHTHAHWTVASSVFI